MSIAAEPVKHGAIDSDLEQYRIALTRHCSRMLGSPSEAEDAVQETLLRAWRSHARFERRCATHIWLRRIATNVCIDMLHGRSRRAEPVDPATLANACLEAGAETDPAAQVLARENFRLAMLTATERLPARQRAVLLLREGLCWKASEVAEHLGTTSAAVNSALQRARGSLAA
jgi:RNA polymerase sigma-70 factor (ECF subfamily)